MYTHRHPHIGSSLQVAVVVPFLLCLQLQSPHLNTRCPPALAHHSAFLAWVRISAFIPWVPLSYSFSLPLLHHPTALCSGWAKRFAHNQTGSGLTASFLPQSSQPPPPPRTRTREVVGLFPLHRFFLPFFHFFFINSLAILLGSSSISDQRRDEVGNTHAQTYNTHNMHEGAGKQRFPRSTELVSSLHMHTHPNPPCSIPLPRSPREV
jgi:hypothetical protein